MKKLLLGAIGLSTFAHAELQLVKKPQQEPQALQVAYLTLTKTIEDFEPIVQALKKQVSDTSIDVIILHINSPGGYPGNTQVIADFIEWAKQIKPIIAFVSDMGTSGAYWVAAACSYIIATEPAHIGSIGVVSELPKKNKSIAFTAGRHKRVHYLADGIIDPDDAEMIQERINQSYEIFCTVISRLRHIPVETLKSFEAQVFLGAQALEKGLIDQVGSLQDVFEKAVEMGSTKHDTAPSLLRVIMSPTETLEFTL